MCASRGAEVVDDLLKLSALPETTSRGVEGAEDDRKEDDELDGDSGTTGSRIEVSYTGNRIARFMYGALVRQALTIRA